MELEGLKMAITNLQEAGLMIDSLVTDRHPSVNKWLHDNMPAIKHYYDIWPLQKVNFPH